MVGSFHGKEKEKDKELERRALGKNLLDFKQKQVEGWGWVGYGWVWSGRKTDDMIRAALSYFRWRRDIDKEEEQVARERVKAQIDQDRADRAAR